MVKRSYLLAGIGILILAVFFIVVLFNLALLMHWILPGPGAVKTNSCGTQFEFLNSPDPHNETQQVSGENVTFSFQVMPSDDCLLVTLVDYREVPFYYNEDFNTTHFLGDGSGKSGHYSGIIRVENLSEGYHDVVLLAFVAPNNSSYDFWNRNTDLMLTQLLRFNVIVNSSVKPLPVFENRSTALNAAYRDGHIVQGGFARQPFDTRVWNRQSVKPGQTIDYYQQVSSQIFNGQDIGSTFAIVQLLDYAQVPVRYNTTDTVYYGYVAGNETCSVHLSVRAPDTPGPHRLVVISVERPFAAEERAPGEYRGMAGPITKVEYLDLFVEK